MYGVLLEHMFHMVQDGKLASIIDQLIYFVLMELQLGSLEMTALAAGYSGMSTGP